MSENATVLMDEVELGIETEAFLNGEIGCFLVEGLERKAKAAGSDLKEVDPNNVAQIVKLQLICEISNDIQGMLAGLIQAGWYAEDELKQKEM